MVGSGQGALGLHTGRVGVMKALWKHKGRTMVGSVPWEHDGRVGAMEAQ